jgi:SpoVK/Ycf46/Vps4 family AAA+-type ATPase
MDAIEDFGRPLETVVLKDTLKSAIVEKIDTFIQNKQAYLDHGHRHQYGMAWIGPPGCGKTSLVDAIAKRYGFAIYVFSLGDATLTDSAMIQMYLSMKPKAIAVFNDIDKFQIGERMITEAALLMLLDGIGSKGKTLVKIMTCSDWEMVSPAVRRRGRIDQEYHFSLASRIRRKGYFYIAIFGRLT